jgi:hypothetical protein
VGLLVPVQWMAVIGIDLVVVDVLQ